MCDTVAPAAFIPMTCHRWLMVLFPMTKSNWPVKKVVFGVTKVVLVSTLLFKDYMVIFTHFCQTCYQVCTHHTDNFLGSHSMSNTIKNKSENFLQEFFSRGIGYLGSKLVLCCKPDSFVRLPVGWQRVCPCHRIQLRFWPRGTYS